ncbi:MAG TPA: cupin domain-containing protein [Candidatus Dormibacteraeota bacterium]|nr:cupin domain-containing protein [Candidatus Dormibacteraeota bacterium]
MSTDSAENETKSRLSNLKLTRRSLLGAVPLTTAGLSLASLAGASLADTQQEKPKVGRVAHKESPLENFKYDLDASTGFIGEGGTAKEVTVAEFPVSQSIAGVSMVLKPGAIRELHWHAIAAEWAYVIEGNVRTTVLNPKGEAAQDDFGPGDIWYFPKGHPHSIQNLGPGDTHFILVFDDGHFSEFGTFSIADWFSQVSPEVLSRNSGLSLQTIAGLPKGEVYITPGKVPPREQSPFRNGDPVISQGAHKFRLLERDPQKWPGGKERVVDSRDFPMSQTVVGAIMDLEPGSLREMHWHPNADEWQYYIKGRARVGIFGAHGRSKVEEFAPGQVAFVKQGFGHYIEQVGDEPTRILITFPAAEYQEISLSTWLSNNPPQLIEDNFGISAEDVARMPKSKLAIYGPHPK